MIQEKTKDKLMVVAIVFILSLLLAGVFLNTGCTSTKQIKNYNGAQLVKRHIQHYNFWESANMEIIDELILRGGIPASARPEYVAGAYVHSRTANPVTPWGTSPGIEFFDWEALGYATHADWLNSEFFGRGTAPDVVIFSSGGVTTVRNLGGGSFSARRYGR